jgi:hypothetical protein
MNDRRKTDKANVIIPGNLDVPPEPHEITATWILARYYNTAVEFLRPIGGYKIKTPDMKMNGQEWEIKSPTGKSKTNVGHQLESASKQSKYIIYDGRRSGLDDAIIQRRIRYELESRSSIRKLIYINKKSEVIEF